MSYIYNIASCLPHRQVYDYNGAKNIIGANFRNAMNTINTLLGTRYSSFSQLTTDNITTIINTIGANTDNAVENSAVNIALTQARTYYPYNERCYVSDNLGNSSYVVKLSEGTADIVLDTNYVSKNYGYSDISIVNSMPLETAVYEKLNEVTMFRYLVGNTSGNIECGSNVTINYYEDYRNYTPSSLEPFCERTGSLVYHPRDSVNSNRYEPVKIKADLLNTDPRILSPDLTSNNILNKMYKPRVFPYNANLSYYNQRGATIAIDAFRHLSNELDNMSNVDNRGNYAAYYDFEYVNVHASFINGAWIMYSDNKFGMECNFFHRGLSYSEAIKRALNDDISSLTSKLNKKYHYTFALTDYDFTPKISTGAEMGKFRLIGVDDCNVATNKITLLMSELAKRELARFNLSPSFLVSNISVTHTMIKEELKQADECYKSSNTAIPARNAITIMDKSNKRVTLATELYCIARNLHDGRTDPVARYRELYRNYPLANAYKSFFIGTTWYSKFDKFEDEIEMVSNLVYDYLNFMKYMVYNDATQSFTIDKNAVTFDENGISEDDDYRPNRSTTKSGVEYSNIVESYILSSIDGNCDYIKEHNRTFPIIHSNNNVWSYILKRSKSLSPLFTERVENNYNLDYTLRAIRHAVIDTCSSSLYNAVGKCFRDGSFFKRYIPYYYTDKAVGTYFTMSALYAVTNMNREERDIFTSHYARYKEVNPEWTMYEAYAEFTSPNEIPVSLLPYSSSSMNTIVSEYIIRQLTIVNAEMYGCIEDMLDIVTVEEDFRLFIKNNLYKVTTDYNIRQYTDTTEDYVKYVTEAVEYVKNSIDRSTSSIVVGNFESRNVTTLKGVNFSTNNDGSSSVAVNKKSMSNSRFIHLLTDDYNYLYTAISQLEIIIDAYRFRYENTYLEEDVDAEITRITKIIDDARLGTFALDYLIGQLEISTDRINDILVTNPEYINSYCKDNADKLKIVYKKDANGMFMVEDYEQIYNYDEMSLLVVIPMSRRVVDTVRTGLNTYELYTDRDL